jgi:hypothetical protein
MKVLYESEGGIFTYHIADGDWGTTVRVMADKGVSVYLGLYSNVSEAKTACEFVELAYSI